MLWAMKIVAWSDEVFNFLIQLRAGILEALVSNDFRKAIVLNVAIGIGFIFLIAYIVQASKSPVFSRILKSQWEKTLQMWLTNDRARADRGTSAND